MSTKAIREALSMLEDALTHPNATDDDRAVLMRAMTEVVAIREAAKTLERLSLAGLKDMSAENIRAHSEAEYLLFTIAAEES